MNVVQYLFEDDEHGTKEWNIWKLINAIVSIRLYLCVRVPVILARRFDKWQLSIQLIRTIATIESRNRQTEEK